MRIFIINPYYFPNMPGGTEQVVKLLAEEYIKMGHKAFVFTGDSPDNEMHNETVNGVKVYRGIKGKFIMHPKKDKNNSLPVKIRNNIRHRYNIPVKKELEKIIDIVKPDVIHTQNLYGISTTVWKTARRKNIPLIHTLHDYWLSEPKIMFWAKLNSKYVDYITAPSAYTLEKFKKTGIFDCSKSAVIPNGIPLNMEYHKKIVEQKKQRTDSTIRFLYVGQLIEKKGLPLLLKAYSKLSAEKKIKTELHICGTGYLKNDVLKTAENDKTIIYHGFVDKDGLKKVYELCDVLAAPSVWEEPFGMVAIEAFYYGLTVIGGNVGGLSEILKNMKVGKIIEPSVDNLIEAMKYYSSREKIISNLAALKNDILQYSISNQAEGFLKLYKY